MTATATMENSLSHPSPAKIANRSKDKTSTMLMRTPNDPPCKSRTQRKINLFRPFNVKTIYTYKGLF